MIKSITLKHKHGAFKVELKDGRKVEIGLPHGNGIDSAYSIEETRRKVYITNSYHAMNDVGMYIGWIDFSFMIDKKEPNNSRVVFHTNGRGYKYVNDADLRGYLDDMLLCHLREALRE